MSVFNIKSYKKHALVSLFSGLDPRVLSINQWEASPPAALVAGENCVLTKANFDLPCLNNYRASINFLNILRLDPILHKSNPRTF